MTSLRPLLGLGPAEGLGREDESIPFCLSGPGQSQVLLLNCSPWESSGKDHPPGHWERI